VHKQKHPLLFSTQKRTRANKELHHDLKRPKHSAMASQCRPRGGKRANLEARGGLYFECVFSRGRRPGAVTARPNNGGAAPKARRLNSRAPCCLPRTSHQTMHTPLNPLKIPATAKLFAPTTPQTAQGRKRNTIFVNTKG
jgi:hypothetical protein